MSERPIAAEEGDGAVEESTAPGAPEQAAAVPTGAPEDARSNEGVAAAERAAEAVSEDLDELTTAQRERDEYLELARRTKADFDNYRKRVARDTHEALVRGRAELARSVVPVLDNLERAVGAAGVDPNALAPSGGADSPSEEVSAHDALARGVALVLRELRETLAKAGVEAYDPMGESFDPAWHEALSTRRAENAEPGIVVETLERGYRLDGQVLRPARVIVSE
ncbi:MAG TPA: nucleotide exchange factor GrpE [Solirubrobacterales bacterium]|jgi:molecular chaperone GrpE|nr:nucleotide exchange factor GrpE [Solirubrobacterales bacterium]